MGEAWPTDAGIAFAPVGPPAPGTDRVITQDDFTADPR